MVETLQRSDRGCPAEPQVPNKLRGTLGADPPALRPHSYNSQAAAARPEGTITRRSASRTGNAKGPKLVQEVVPTNHAGM